MMDPESKPQVLVVDDDKVIADTLAQILIIHGLPAVATYSAQGAIQLAAIQPFDHLLSDVIMHPMNGIELAIAFRHRHPECKILLMSGNNDTSHLMLEARALGHDFEVLAKPVHPQLILDRLCNDHRPK